MLLGEIIFSVINCKNVVLNTHNLLIGTSGGWVEWMEDGTGRQIGSYIIGWAHGAAQLRPL